MGRAQEIHKKLSPFLSTLYTLDHASYRNAKLDDFAVDGCISDALVDAFVELFGRNLLLLNVSKTREMEEGRG